jgi:dipeptidase E
MKKLFLMSSSFHSRTGCVYLGYCLGALKYFLGPINKERKKIIFIPFADPDGEWDEYTRKASVPFIEMGYEFVGVHTYKDPSKFTQDENIFAILIGGGNTWLLNRFLHRLDLVKPTREMVNSGRMKYVGVSAGSVVACKSIITTNDMAPISDLITEGLHIVPFQINAHFVSGSLTPDHKGETREERLRQVLLHNINWEIMCIPEGCWIESSNNEYTFNGPSNGIINTLSEKVVWEPGIIKEKKFYNNCL